MFLNIAVKQPFCCCKWRGMYLFHPQTKQSFQDWSDSGVPAGTANAWQLISSLHHSLWSVNIAPDQERPPKRTSCVIGGRLVWSEFCFRCFPSDEIRLMQGKTEPPEGADTAGAAKLILWRAKVQGRQHYGTLNEKCSRSRDAFTCFSPVCRIAHQGKNEQYWKGTNQSSRKCFLSTLFHKFVTKHPPSIHYSTAHWFICSFFSTAICETEWIWGAPQCKGCSLSLTES